MFHQYENEYCAKSTDLSRQILSISSLSGDMRRRKIAEVGTGLRDADSVIKRMDMEARSLPAEHSRTLLVKVKEYRGDLTALRDQLKANSTAPSGGDAARMELGLGPDYYSSTTGQRERMLGATERLQKTSNRLQVGKQSLLQTEELGTQILTDLARQRDTITHARDTLHSADDNITKARKILTSMSRRVWQNKLIMFGIAAFLVMAIALIVWAKVRS